jgi:two-component system LytT family response regulator
MNALRVVVADDEPLILADLVRLLAAIPGVEVVGQARNGLETLDLVSSAQPEALFLDVQMPALDGFGVVAELDPDTAPAVVFVTSFDQYAIRAFDAHAVDYLLKPFDPPRLQLAVERVRSRVAGNRAEALSRTLAALPSRPADPTPRYLERLAARGVRRTVLLDVASIQWVEAADNYVRLHTADDVHLSRRTMRDLEASLDPRRFARIHRGTIVALDQVRELRPLGDGDQELRLRDGTRLELTRSYRDSFTAHFGGIA